jgi:hypothetical protein
MSDGKDLLRRLRQLLNEDSDSGWLDDQSSYDWLYDAAGEFVDRTGCLRAEQEITTVAEQTDYDMNPDYLRLYLKNSSGNHYVKYNNGSTNTFATFKDYEDLYYQDNTGSVSTPGKFSIIDADLPSQVTGSAGATSAASGGQCTLSGSGFGDVEAGATVHNTTDSSAGIVLSKTSSSALVTALFGGTDNDWTSGDAYVIQPQARNKLVLDPPPSTAGHTVTLPYVARPKPVYSDYGVYRFVNPSVLVKYAFWMYKYKDSEPNFGDSMYRFWEMEIGRKSHSINQGQRPGSFTVNLKARR